MCEAMAVAAHASAVEQGIEVHTITILVVAFDEGGRPLLSVNSTGYDNPREMIEGTLANLVESALSLGIVPGMGGTTEPPDGFPPGGFAI